MIPFCYPKHAMAYLFYKLSSNVHMKSRILSVLSVLAAFAFLLSSCAKDTIEPETLGNIGGLVIDGETEEGIGTVNITTTPATEAIFTQEDGAFSIDNIPTGNYTVQARKTGYNSSSVSVAVREGTVATAFISLSPEEEDPDSSVTMDQFSAGITSWFNEVDGDTTHVSINYLVENNSDSGTISNYEVYFQVETDSGVSFYFDIAGENLQAGQNRSGNFRGYIRDNEATEVTINDVWISD
jgi:hypothetical protein